MGVNIEIKARTRDLERQRQIARSLCDSGPELLEQTDTFFNVCAGRLKLREFASGQAELIHYERPDRTDPAKSSYVIVPVTEAGPLKGALAAALGVVGVVRKERHYYPVGQTRVHFDKIEGLGDFIELEVVLSAGQSQDEAVTMAHRLMQRLEIQDADLIECAYVDMLAAPVGRGPCAH
jgi:predicted adenylyl cyclase CyaB